MGLLDIDDEAPAGPFGKTEGKPATVKELAFTICICAVFTSDKEGTYDIRFITGTFTGTDIQEIMTRATKGGADKLREDDGMELDHAEIVFMTEGFHHNLMADYDPQADDEGGEDDEPGPASGTPAEGS